jgi:hypothetical protein
MPLLMVMAANAGVTPRALKASASRVTATKVVLLNEVFICILLMKKVRAGRVARPFAG